jgi:hypothetical protein
MPNATVRANARAMPIDRRLFLAAGTAAAVFGALHAEASPPILDAEIFAAARAVEKVDEAYKRLAARADEWESAGRELSPEDDAALYAASDVYEEALAALLSLAPSTVGGVRVMLKALAGDGLLERERAVDALEWLCDCPALGGEA